MSRKDEVQLGPLQNYVLVGLLVIRSDSPPAII